MREFLKKHNISLNKPALAEETLSISVKPLREKSSKPLEVFIFEDSIHFARFITANQESLSPFKLLHPILNYTTAYSRACCGDSRRNWQNIIDKSVTEILSNQNNQELLDKIKSLLNTKKVVYKGETEISF